MLPNKDLVLSLLVEPVSAKYARCCKYSEEQRNENSDLHDHLLLTSVVTYGRTTHDA